MPWYILDRSGVPMDVEELPRRPPDAQNSYGDPFTPWYNPNPHLHITDGKIVGVHCKGSLTDAQQLLRRCFLHEAELRRRLGFCGDTDIADVVPVLEVLEQEQLLHELQEIPNPTQTLLPAENSYTVADLIKDVRDLTPRGREHLSLRIQAQDILHRLRLD